MMYSKLVIRALVVLTLVLNAFALNADIDCPKLPRSCSCSRDHQDEPKKIECRKVRYKEMKNVFENNAGYNFKNIEITRSKLKNASLFVNLFVEKLELKFCQIRKFTLFEGLDSLRILKSLVIERVAVKRITSNPSELSQMEEFVLLDCPVGCNDQSNKMIEYIPGNLNSIEIRWCRVNLGEHFSFRRFQKLERLRLNHNRLTEFKRSYLPEPAAQLRLLSLSKNPISSLPEDMFSNMPALTTIQLVEMELSILQYDVFKPLLNQRKFVELAHNPLICNCHNSWILAELVNWEGQVPTCASPNVFKGKRMSELLPVEMCQIPGENFQETLEQYCDAKLKNNPFSG